MRNTILTAICALAAICPGHAQEKMDEGTGMIFSDLGPLLKERTFVIGASHKAGRHWSAGGYAGIQIGSRKIDEEEMSHDNEFSEKGQTENTSSNNLMTAGLFVRFWPDETYAGPFISVGTVIRGERKTDCTAGIGYCMKIWRCLHTSISVETDLITSYREQTFKGNGIGISICFIF